MRKFEQEHYFRTLDRQVAVKIIDKSKMTDRELEILMREVGVLKLLDHPNIVRLYEIIEAEDTLYLIQEYCPGGEFYDSIVPHGMALEVCGKDQTWQCLLPASCARIAERPGISRSTATAKSWENCWYSLY
jgi:serine/threonine protein kinase